MKEIALDDAPATWIEVAEAVSQTGEPVTLTRDGRPYVDLVKHHEGAAPVRRSKPEIFAELALIRAGLPKTSDAEIRAGIEQG